MSNRPAINNKISGETFKSYYYLREELIAFLRQEGMQTTGGKIELTNRIAHYLDLGEKLWTKSSPKTTKDIRTITENSFRYTP